MSKVHSIATEAGGKVAQAATPTSTAATTLKSVRTKPAKPYLAFPFGADAVSW